MDVDAEVLAYVNRLPVIQDWPELKAIIQKAAVPNAAVWRLPQLACEAVGGQASLAIPAMAAVGCLQVSIILIDDLLDADPRGEYRRLGAPVTANVAVAAQAAGLQAILESTSAASARLATVACLNQMILTTAAGQHCDIQNPADEDGYWQLVRMKSAPFFGAALQTGALLGGASPELAFGLREVGSLYGEMIQIHDDLHDTMAVPANPDWTQDRSSLPILFGQLMPHPERARFLELRQSATDPEALGEAQNILMRCGAVSYCLDEIGRRYVQALDALRGLPLAHRAGLKTLLATQMRPVEELLRSLKSTSSAGDCGTDKAKSITTEGQPTLLLAGAPQARGFMAPDAGLTIRPA